MAFRGACASGGFRHRGAASGPHGVARAFELWLPEPAHLLVARAPLARLLGTPRPCVVWLCRRDAAWVCTHRQRIGEGGEVVVMRLRCTEHAEGWAAQRRLLVAPLSTIVAAWERLRARER